MSLLFSGNRSDDSSKPAFPGNPLTAVRKDDAGQDIPDSSERIRHDGYCRIRQPFALPDRFRHVTVRTDCKNPAAGHTEKTGHPIFSQASLLRKPLLRFGDNPLQFRIFLQFRFQFPDSVFVDIIFGLK